MYSINVPVPNRVRSLANALHPSLVAFDRIREDHTLLVKRLGSSDHPQALQQEVHRALEGTPVIEARITHIDYFRSPPMGPAPVVYLAVESPALIRLHEELVERFDPVVDLEGESYVPHVTLARGGDIEDAKRISSQSIEPITWSITSLEFRDGTYRVPISEIALPS